RNSEQKAKSARAFHRVFPPRIPKIYADCDQPIESRCALSTTQASLGPRSARGSTMAKIDAIAEVKRVLKMEGDAILRAADRLKDPDAAGKIETALSLLQQALARGGKIVVCGLGKSGKIGQKIVATFCSTGTLAVYLHPTEGLHGDLGLVSPNDALLALSYTGNTDELVRLMPSIKSLRVPTIGMGGNAQSRLAGLCDIWIDASVEAEACPHNLAPTCSTTLALAIGDALAIALM